MALSPALSKCLKPIRVEIGGLNSVNHRSFKKNVTAWLSTLRQYLVPTTEIDAAMGAVLSCCEKLLAEVDLFATDKAPLQAAQHRAFKALDELERVLESAKPSEMANHLGLGWSWRD